MLSIYSWLVGAFRVQTTISAPMTLKTPTTEESTLECNCITEWYLLQTISVILHPVEWRYFITIPSYKMIYHSAVFVTTTTLAALACLYNKTSTMEAGRPPPQARIINLCLLPMLASIVLTGRIKNRCHSMFRCTIPPLWAPLPHSKLV